MDPLFGFFRAVLVACVFGHGADDMFKRTKKPKPEKPPRVAQRTDQFYTAQMSTDHLTHIGRIVAHWSKLEGAMQEVIWEFLELPIDSGRIITERLDVTSKLRISRALAVRKLTGETLENFLTVMDVIENRQGDRNFIAHGLWAHLMPEDVPIAMSLKPKSEPGEVISETFPESRMVEILKDIIETKAALIEFKAGLAASRGKPDGPDHPG